MRRAAEDHSCRRRVGGRDRGWSDTREGPLAPGRGQPPEAGEGKGLPQRRRRNTALQDPGSQTPDVQAVV